MNEMEQNNITFLVIPTSIRLPCMVAMIGNLQVLHMLTNRLHLIEHLLVMTILIVSR